MYLMQNLSDQNVRLLTNSRDSFDKQNVSQKDTQISIY